MFESNVNAPSGVSYAPPVVNFSSLGELLDSYGKGVKTRQETDLANNLKNIPSDPNGGVDYNKLSQIYMQGGNPNAGVALSNLALQRQNQAQALPLISGAFGDGLPGGTASAAGPAAAGGDYFSKLAARESANNPAAVSTAPGSHATGTYQFQPGTWTQVASANPSLGLTPEGITDPTQQYKAVRAFTDSNRASLKASGFDPNDQNAYLAHFLGAQGATKFLTGAAQNPDQPAAALASPAAVKANQSLFFDPSGKPVSAKDFYTNLTKDFAPQAAAQPQQAQGGIPPQVQRLMQIGAYLSSQGNPAGAVLVQAGMEMLRENKPTLIKTGTSPFTGQISHVWARPGETVGTPVSAPGGGGTGGGGLLAKGVTEPNSDLVGDAYLAQFSPEVQAGIKNDLSGAAQISSNPRLRAYESQVKQWAQKYAGDKGIPYNEAMFPARRAQFLELQKGSSSSLGGQIASGQNSAEHLANASDAAVRLNNANASWEPTILAHGINSVRGQSQAQANVINELEREASIYGGERTKALTGSPGTNEERQVMAEKFGGGKLSNPEMAGLLRGELTQLLGALRTQERRILQTNGPDVLKQYPVFTDETKAHIQRLEDNIALLEGKAPKASTPGYKGERGQGVALSPPSMQSVLFLRSHPDTKADFDARYGAGASDMVLGKK